MLVRILSGLSVYQLVAIYLWTTALPYGVFIVRDDQLPVSYTHLTLPTSDLV